MRRSGVVSLLFAAVSASPPAFASLPPAPGPGAFADEPILATRDMRSPESAAWHPESSSWFVSNMGGVSFDLGPDAGLGYLSRIHAGGTVEPKLALECAGCSTTLDRPRGVAAGPTHLFVAERTALAVIDVATLTIVRRVPIPGGEGDLNDVLFDRASGWAFVSAPSTDSIFVVRQPLSVTAHSELWLESPELTQPNGLALEPGFVVSAGLGLASGTPGGRLVRIDRLTKAITPITDPLGALDGLVKDGDDYLVTEYVTGNVYRVARDGTTRIEWKLAPGSADLGIDPVRRVIAVPETLLNVTVTLPLL